MTAQLAIDADPGAEPYLGHAAVEAARLIRQSRTDLIERHPSVTIEMLAKGRVTKPATARQWLQRHRQAGRIITVDDDGRVLLPLYQLDEAFDLRADVAALTESLTAAGMSPWATWRWFTTTNPWLEARPIELLNTPDENTLSRLRKAVDHLVVA